MSKEQAIQAAQRKADETNMPMAVFNLNRFNPLYVVRQWSDSFAAQEALVCRINPHGIPTDGAGNVLVPSYPINDRFAAERAVKRKD